MTRVNNMMWEEVSLSFKPDADAHFSEEREVTVEILVKERKIVIEISNRLQYMGRYEVIPFLAIEETLSPRVPQDSHILKLEGGEQIKFKFGTRSAKDSFVEAITICM
jgi:hypothetical protein